MTTRPRSNWGLPVDAGVSGPERDLPRVRVGQPVVFVVGLVGQRAGDLLQIEAAQVKHQAGTDPPLPALKYRNAHSRHVSALPVGS